MEADLVELRSSKPSVTSDYLSAVDPDIRFAHALALDILAAPAIEGGPLSQSMVVVLCLESTISKARLPH